VYIACSTLCFGRYSLEQALRTIAELEFQKVDVAIYERGCQLKPTEVANDVSHAAQRLRHGTSLTPAAFSVEIEADGDEDYQRQLRAICRLARLTTVPLVSVPAAPSSSDLVAEARRLATLVAIAASEGILLTIETRMGTVAEEPAAAVELCQRVPGLGLALDPSHYLAGPNQGRSYDQVYPFVRHVRLRDTGRGPDQFQVRIGQGEIEYGRIISQLCRYHFNRLLTVDIRDIPDAPFEMGPEVRKLKFLLESLV
jgi:sugar phosphate isomerase/epimerase